MVPMQSVEHAIREMKFARRDLGFRACFLRPNPYHGTKMINDPMYEPFWAAAEDLDMAIGFHEGGSSGMPTVGIDRFEGRAARHIVSHTMEMMLACLAVIWGGVCEKHPKIRIGFLESGGGWIAPWLDRMDRHFDDQGFNDSGLKTRPSELFQRNCWISFEPVEGSLKFAGGLYRPQQDHVGDRLPASRRLLSRRPRHGARAAEGHLARDTARRARRRRDGLLRPELIPDTPPPPRPDGGGETCNVDEFSGTTTRRNVMSGHGHHTPAEIRAKLNHPVVDGDGHWVEYDPVFAEQMRKVGGDLAADGFLKAMAVTRERADAERRRAQAAARLDARLLDPPDRQHATTAPRR